MIVIIDYGMGNLGSVKRKLDRIGADSIITSNADEIKNSDKIILPGVGHFSKAVTEIKKIALVSHNYNKPDSLGLYDYSEHFGRINKFCDDHSCDTILYALYTWDPNSSVIKTHDLIFNGLKNVRQVILEIGRPRPKEYDHVECWIRGRQEPVLAYQRFAKSDSPTKDKQRFMDELSSRQIGTALLVICGETNIGSLVRGSDEFSDPFGFVDRIKKMQTRVILNPIHDYMRRYEMREKRKLYSEYGRLVISVWNQGKGKESKLPWTVFYDGKEKTAQVQAFEKPFDNRTDISIGMLDVSGF